jgi:hypothetical protein
MQQGNAPTPAGLTRGQQRENSNPLYSTEHIKAAQQAKRKKDPFNNDGRKGRRRVRVVVLR